MKATSLCLVAICCLILVGCGGSGNGPETVDAEGILTLDGQPIDGAVISCIPQKAPRHPARGASDKNGRFALTAFEGQDGAVPGEYKVLVSRTVEVAGKAKKQDMSIFQEDAEHLTEAETSGAQWKNDLPHKYAKVDETDLLLVIPETGSTSLELKLVSQGE